mmetsp:Transcript_15551/g.31815  ORF Transcript_15551/g.31815 Transcript_15551/m.31815 type:complete len:91 (+) Transcript_15551:3248-3520(+)
MTTHVLQPMISGAVNHRHTIIFIKQVCISQTNNGTIPPSNHLSTPPFTLFEERKNVRNGHSSDGDCDILVRLLSLCCGSFNDVAKVNKQQ